jgi:hypothetical protein
MNLRSRWILLPLLALSAFIAVVPVAGAASGKSSVAGPRLYVQSVDGGSLRHVKGGFELELTGVSPRVSTFTDRLRGGAGTERLGTFIGGWAKAGFAADPPEAALVLDHAPSSRDIAMLTLGHPRYDRRAHTLSFRVHPLRGKATEILAAFAEGGDPVRAGDFGAASLFVANGAAQVAQDEVKINVRGATPGQPFKLLVSSGRFAITQSSRSYGPLQIYTEKPGLPLTDVTAIPGAILVETVPGGPALNFTLDATIEFEGATPTLTVEGGAGAMITATWPTDTGTQTQTMLPSNPLVLTGIFS